MFVACETAALSVVLHVFFIFLSYGRSLPLHRVGDNRGGCGRLPLNDLVPDDNRKQTVEVVGQGLRLN